MVNVDEAIIAKYEYSGEHFEILVDPDLAADFRSPDGPDVAIEDLLAVEEIFKDSKKGDKASDEAMNKKWSAFIKKIDSDSFDYRGILKVIENHLREPIKTVLAN